MGTPEGKVWWTAPDRPAWECCSKEGPLRPERTGFLGAHVAPKYAWHSVTEGSWTFPHLIVVISERLALAVSCVLNSTLCCRLIPPREPGSSPAHGKFLFKKKNMLVLEITYVSSL